MRLSLGIEAQPEAYVITKWLDAMPKYDIHHREAVRKLEEALAAYFPNVFLAGCSSRCRHSGLHGERAANGQQNRREAGRVSINKNTLARKGANPTNNGTLLDRARCLYLQLP